jgi:hypothetical protein
MGIRELCIINNIPYLHLSEQGTSLHGDFKTLCPSKLRVCSIVSEIPLN